MAGLAFDRASLRFAARRLERGIQLSAWFDAPKLSTGEDGFYSVNMTVDPQTRAIVSEPRVHLKHKGSEHLVTHGGGMDDLLKFAYEIRDIFLKSPAWTILKDQQPDPHFSVDQAGAQHITTPASRRDIFR